MARCRKHQRSLKKSTTEGLGCNPADWGRSGSKLHLHVDGHVVPLETVIAVANVHDSCLLGVTLKNSHFCPDKHQ